MCSRDSVGVSQLWHCAQFSKFGIWDQKLPILRVSLSTLKMKDWIGRWMSWFLQPFQMLRFDIDCPFIVSRVVLTLSSRISTLLEVDGLFRPEMSAYAVACVVAARHSPVGWK
ncbi:hypothetical protein SCLCIDRAFT_1154833 [Scleroderma citrinum Foug A]|uniref:Uncharacterized protein n=1 Tax=Scleroderma citrinum Foug A TaxID=1036808 RepID=A0A0C2ZNQ8_9AGAM|nr:hypothetical protein SCLCIDRAFT_1154833 [Scleroderma citrinum Foug A]